MDRVMRGHTVMVLSVLLVAFALLCCAIAIGKGEVNADGTATVRYVLDDGGVDVDDCADAQAPCRTVHYAVGQANDGDTLRVANQFSSAVYTGTLVLTKSVTLEGGWAVVSHPQAGLLWDRPMPCEPSRTVLDAEHDGQVIKIEGHVTPTIECFTLTGGQAGRTGAGGGILSRGASPIIVGNVITGNYAASSNPFAGVRRSLPTWGSGGGICLKDAPAQSVISGNLIANNVASPAGGGVGGGIALVRSQTQVLSNTIVQNQAGQTQGNGGGIAVDTIGPERTGSLAAEADQGPVIRGNTIVSNAGSTSGHARGGGLHIIADVPVLVEDNVVRHNWALRGPGDAGATSLGGGISWVGVGSGLAVVRGNSIRDNVASLWSQPGYGGGLYLANAAIGSVVVGNEMKGNTAGYNGDGHGGGLCVVGGQLEIHDNLIAGNDATWTGGTYGKGGGIYAADSVALITSNVISANNGVGFLGFPANARGYGGGLSLEGGETTVRDNLIIANAATKAENEGQGGGISVKAGTITLEENTIADNRTSPEGLGGAGGGVFIGGSSGAVVQRNVIHGNVADQDGGGLSLTGADGSVVTRNQIFSNTASYRNGGGVYVGDSDSVTIAQNVVLWNHGSSGGGFYLYSGGTDGRVLRLENNVLGHNGAAVGGGVYVKGIEVHFLHTTLALNDAGCGSGDGVYVTSATARLTNTIVVSHDVGIYVSGDSTATVASTLWGDGGWGNTLDWDGAGDVTLEPCNLHEDPDFVDPPAGDFHLSAGSPAIGCGVPAGIASDVDGDPRLGGPDLGADEYVRLGFLPLVLKSDG